MAKNINIGGRLHSVAVGNVLAGADEISDDLKGKKQSQINAEVDAAIDALQEGVENAGKVDDVKVNGVSVLEEKEANIIVPTKVSDLTNDSGYQDADDVQQAITEAIPTKVSDLDNDSEFATSNEVEDGLSLKQDSITVEGETLII